MSNEPFNEANACEAVVRYLEERHNSKRQAVFLPGKDHSAPVDLVCTIAGRKFAFEHTGIEPFHNQIKFSIDYEKFMAPVKAKVTPQLPPDSFYELYTIIDATEGLKPKTIPKIQEALIKWVCDEAPKLIASPLGRHNRSHVNVTVRGVPFLVSLYRVSRTIKGYPPFVAHHTISSNRLEQERVERLRRAYTKKLSQLAPWKKDDNARTVLILEENDRENTSQQIVADIILNLVEEMKDRPDEIYIVMTWHKVWWVSPVLVDETTIFDLGKKWVWEIDSTALVESLAA